VTGEEPRLREQTGGVSLAASNRSTEDDLIPSGELSDAQAEQRLSIARRLGDWKTLVSFGFAVLVLVFVIAKGGIDPAAIWARVRTANPLFIVVAVVVYYSTFPIRGYRWKILLQNAYAGEDSSGVDSMTIRGLAEIIYISWFVNCVVPAKLGDLYRAYLAKLWVNISWTKTIGTVLAERIIDILVLGLLLASTGFIVFHGKLGGVGEILLLGVALAVVGILLLVAMKVFSERIRRLVPTRFQERYIGFEEGTLQSFKRMPLILSLTVLVWFLEGARLQFVFFALGLHSTDTISSIPFAPMIFFALGTAVLTTVPFTPGGLGLVEAGLGGMMIYLGVPKTDAVAVVLVDRLISYYSVAALGFFVYLMSKRSHFHIQG
jgi:glycosyltransferase 2 family protein